MVKVGNKTIRTIPTTVICWNKEISEQSKISDENSNDTGIVFSVFLNFLQRFVQTQFFEYLYVKVFDRDIKKDIKIYD